MGRELVIGTGLSYSKGMGPKTFKIWIAIVNGNKG